MFWALYREEEFGSGERSGVEEKKYILGRNSMCRIGWWAMLWHLGTNDSFSAANTCGIHEGVVSGMRPGGSVGTKDCVCPVWGLLVPVCIRITWTSSTGVDQGPSSDSKNHFNEQGQ